MEKRNFKEISFRLKQSRESNNITLEEAGQKVGVHKSTVLRWENGETEKIKLPVLEALASLYNVNTMWLMGYDVPMKRDYKKDTPDLSELIINEYGKDSLMFLEDYNKLNEKGKKRARDNIKDLKKVGEYTCQDTETEQTKNA